MESLLLCDLESGFTLEQFAYLSIGGWSVVPNIGMCLVWVPNEVSRQSKEK